MCGLKLQHAPQQLQQSLQAKLPMAIHGERIVVNLWPEGDRQSCNAIFSKGNNRYSIQRADSITEFTLFSLAFPNLELSGCSDKSIDDLGWI
jgi:hypothetical protein